MRKVVGSLSKKNFDFCAGEWHNSRALVSILALLVQYGPVMIFKGLVCPFSILEQAASIRWQVRHPLLFGK